MHAQRNPKDSSRWKSLGEQPLEPVKYSLQFRKPLIVSINYMIGKIDRLDFFTIKTNARIQSIPARPKPLQ